MTQKGSAQRWALELLQCVLALSADNWGKPHPKVAGENALLPIRRATSPRDDEPTALRHSAG
jgi:hypothetical protein